MLATGETWFLILVSLTVYRWPNSTESHLINFGSLINFWCISYWLPSAVLTIQGLSSATYFNIFPFWWHFCICENTMAAESQACLVSSAGGKHNCSHWVNRKFPWVWAYIHVGRISLVDRTVIQHQSFELLCFLLCKTYLGNSGQKFTEDIDMFESNLKGIFLRSSHEIYEE